MQSSSDRKALFFDLETNEKLKNDYKEEEMLSFGTSGLRAKIGSGFGHLNNAVIKLATTALAKELIRKGNGEKVVIGYDQRHHSREFAETAAACLLGQGLDVLLFDAFVPTPLLAFAVIHLGAITGIMITASHNPKDDNGYKVYSERGCQIISPLDKNIASRMKKLILQDVKIGNLCKVLFVKSAQVFAEYLKKLPLINLTLLPKIIYTPVHGVGWRYVEEMVSSLIPVEGQKDPNPDFPTVKFPNPEEGKDTLRMALTLADKQHSKLVMANDPDVDRFALAEKTEKSGWKVFTGNEIAAMFSMFLWEKRPRNVAPEDCYMLTTSVSSRLIRKMAQKEGFHVQSTFTGFKNIGNLAADLKEQGKHILFAFEEAIGFMIGETVWEKDGISSLNLACRMAAQLYSEGKTFTDYLQEIHEKYGRMLQLNSYYYITSLETTRISNTIFTHIRQRLSAEEPTNFRTALEIANVIDHAPSNFVILEMHDGWVAFRCSGTEPKIKYYSETVCGRNEEILHCYERLTQRVNRLCIELLRPKENELKHQNEIKH